MGEIRAFSVCLEVESALVDIALLTFVGLGSVLVGDVLSLSDESCLRFRYSFMDSWKRQSVSKCRPFTTESKYLPFSLELAVVQV